MLARKKVSIKNIHNLGNGNHLYFDIHVLKHLEVNLLSVFELEKLYHQLIHHLVYASSENIRKISLKKIYDIENCLQKSKSKLSQLTNTGLPFTSTIACFSLDAVIFLSQQNDCQLKLNEINTSKTKLCSFLHHSLPSLEREEALEHNSDQGFLRSLKINKNELADFIIGEFRNLKCSPNLKDKEWKNLAPFFKIQYTKPTFSLGNNRLKVSDYFYHKEILKKPDIPSILNKKLPLPEKLSPSFKNEVIEVIKKTMILYLRETDPTTYMDPNSLKYYKLERGISVALYGMTQDRQLALESYIGYTLFINGIPVAYGGGWIFGAFARFGLNIFDPFRGGESEFIFAQLLRLYIGIFALKSIEIEPYQLGQGNDDGINSGVYWFYYKFGFRTKNARLAKLAELEFNKKQNQPGYKSSTKTLVQLSKASIFLYLDENTYPYVIEFTKGFNLWVKTKFKSSRYWASLESKNILQNHLKISNTNIISRLPAFEEWALIYHFKYAANKKELPLILKLIKTKSKDPYLYNKILITLLGECSR